MAKTWKQNYDLNPTAIIDPNDILYLARSPYTPTTDDFCILWSDILSQILIYVKTNTQDINTWITTTTATQAIAVQTGYFANDPSSLVTFTLPVTAAVGDVFQIDGVSADGWSIAENAGQTIHFGNDTVTTGTGTLSSSSQHDCVRIRCFITNTDWVVEFVVGNLVST